MNKTRGDAAPSAASTALREDGDRRPERRGEHPERALAHVLAAPASGIDSSDITTLQRVIGNRRVNRLLAGRSPEAAQAGAPIQVKRARPLGSAGLEGAPASARETPDATGVPGPVLAKFERAFGTDLSGVKLHTSSARAAALGALAYTQGTEVHVAPGQWAPETRRGQELLGHELWHVVQQREGRVAAQSQYKGVGLNDDAALEAEADRMGEKAARGEAAAGSQETPARVPSGAASSGAPVQRKVGFEFEIAVPVRYRDGTRPRNKTVVGDFEGTKFEVDNSRALLGLSDHIPSCIEMVTPAFDETPKQIGIGLEHVAALATVAKRMLGAVNEAWEHARRGLYNENQPLSAARVDDEHHESDLAIRDIPTLVPDDDSVADMMTRFGLIYPDFRLGLLSRDPDGDRKLMSDSANVQATVGIDLAHVESLWQLASDKTLTKGYEEPLPGNIDILLNQMSRVAASNTKQDLKQIDKKAEYYHRLNGVLSILAMYLVGGKFWGQGHVLVKNIAPLVSHSPLHLVVQHGLSAEEQEFLRANIKAIAASLIQNCQRGPNEQLIKDSTVAAVTCEELVMDILSGKSDPLITATGDEDRQKMGSGMGTLIDPRREQVGPVRDPEKDHAPLGTDNRHLGVAMEMRALAPGPNNELPPEEWVPFAEKVLVGVSKINAQPIPEPKPCFLTTACIEARGLPDDCEELTTLRAFRDGYLRARPGGPALIEEYYRIAPAIVAGMKGSPDFARVADDLYHRLVLRSVRLIQSGQLAAALDHYRGIVLELSARYTQPAP